MPYHIELSWSSGSIRQFDLSKEQVEKTFIIPFRENRPIILGHKIIQADQIREIRVVQTEESLADLLPRIRKKRQQRKEIGPAAREPDESRVFLLGQDLTSEFLTANSAGANQTQKESHDPLLLLQELVDSTQALPLHDKVLLDALRRKAELIIKKLFGTSSNYLADLYAIEFSHPSYTANRSDYDRWWREGQGRLLNLLQTMIEDVQLFGGSTDMATRALSAKKVFVVHGHDDAAKQSVARFLERVELLPIILSEQPSMGKTIIEKFEHNADVGFAVVLLIPDDVGYPKDKPSESKSRARQNVILELGYFFARLGRERVCALHKESVELPSDIHGIVYIPMDLGDGWMLKLFKELEAAGMDVSRSNL